MAPKNSFHTTETELDQLIAGCSKKLSVFLQLLKETGVRSGEATRLEWKDFDFHKNCKSEQSREKW